MRSIPIHLLVESQEHVVTVELSSGVTYRGKLLKSEDNMNVHLFDVIVTNREGEKSHMNSAFVRGSHIKMFMLPEVLRFAPVLRPDLATKARGDIKTLRQGALKRPKGSKPPRKQLKMN